MTGYARERLSWRSKAMLAACVALLVTPLISSCAGAPAPPDSGPASGTARPAPGAQRPNIVLIMTDDQSAQQQPTLRRVNELLGEQGTVFENFVVSYPLCCPSRATVLTGQYSHNHRVRGNGPPAGGYQALAGRETLPVWLSRAGYHTAHVGKYLNGYGKRKPREIPPGWDEWHTLTRKVFRYYNYTLNDNGRLTRYGRKPADYQTDVLTDEAVEVVREQSRRRQPFFLWLSYLAPHAGAPNRPQDQRCGNSAVPAPRHAGDFAAAPLPRPPSFNERDVSDKPRFIRRNERFSRSDIADIAENYRCRRESLLAVDQGVAKLMDALRRQGELDNTLILFTSDNGYLRGQHRLARGKIYAYQEVSEVPLIIRGPEIPAGEVYQGLAANIDLAPTILDAANAVPRGHLLDGRSLLPLLGRQPPAPAAPGRAVLLENGPADGRRNPQYDAVRTHRYVYIEYETGRRELYDLYRDRYQLQSVHADPAYARVRQELARALDRLAGCAGRGCRFAVTVPGPRV